MPSGYKTPWDKVVLKALLLSKRVIHPVTGCWLWDGAHNDAGYGMMTISQEQWYVARISIWVYQGDERAVQRSRKIVTCHSCDNPPCFNPEHVSMQTHTVNMQQALSRGRNHQRNKTHCRNGHPFNRENTYLYNGTRKCRVCRRKVNQIIVRSLRWHVTL